MRTKIFDPSTYVDLAYHAIEPGGFEYELDLSARTASASHEAASVQIGDAVTTVWIRARAKTKKKVEKWEEF